MHFWLKHHCFHVSSRCRARLISSRRLLGLFCASLLAGFSGSFGIQCIGWRSTGGLPVWRLEKLRRKLGSEMLLSLLATACNIRLKSSKASPRALTCEYRTNVDSCTVVADSFHDNFICCS